MSWSDSAHHLNLGYKQSFEYIASKDGFAPSNILYSLGYMFGGFKEEPAGVSI